MTVAYLCDGHFLFLINEDENCNMLYLGKDVQHLKEIGILENDYHESEQERKFSGDYILL